MVDGGCDVLLSGNECKLGTPVEDMMHIKAISFFSELKLFVCAIGMNCDVGKGKGFDDFEKGDLIESFKLEQVAQKL